MTSYIFDKATEHLNNKKDEKLDNEILEYFRNIYVKLNYSLKRIF